MCGLASSGPRADIDSFAPVVVKTVPEAGSKDISSARWNQKITFSKK